VQNLASTLKLYKKKGNVRRFFYYHGLYALMLLYIITKYLLKFLPKKTCYHNQIYAISIHYSIIEACKLHKDTFSITSLLAVLTWHSFQPSRNITLLLLLWQAYRLLSCLLVSSESPFFPSDHPSPCNRAPWHPTITLLVEWYSWIFIFLSPCIYVDWEKVPQANLHSFFGAYWGILLIIMILLSRFRKCWLVNVPV
jgi:hypothetical protein